MPRIPVNWRRSKRNNICSPVKWEDGKARRDKKDREGGKRKGKGKKNGEKERRKWLVVGSLMDR